MAVTEQTLSQPVGASSAMISHAPGLRLRSLTTLRFFAAMTVVLFHLRVTHVLDGGPWWYQKFAGIGYVGVNFFFVLSGFILVHTYGGSPVSPRRFWQARFARVYPAYALSLALSAPFFFYAVRHLDIPFFAWSRQHLAAACILTLTLLQSWVPQGALTWNSVCWSLSAEAFFYLSFPLLLLWSKGLRRGTLVGGLVGCSLLSLGFSLLYVLAHPDGADKINSQETTLLWRNVLSFNPLVRLPEFVTGMLAGQLFGRHSRNTHPLAPAAANGTGANPSKGATPLVLGGLGVLVAMILLAGEIPDPLISAGFLSPAFAAIIYGLALRPAWASFLEARWMVLLGEASYSLYLLHSLVISWSFDALDFLPGELRVTTCLAAAIGASLLSFWLVEQPARRLLRPGSASGTPSG